MVRSVLRPRWASLLLLLSLGTAAYVYQRGQLRQQLVVARCATLTADLGAANRRAAQQAAQTMRSLRRVVYLNHNWAPDSAVLSQSEYVWRRAESMADSLRASSYSPEAPSGGSADVLALAQLTTHLSHYEGFIQHLLTKERGQPWAGISHASIEGLKLAPLPVQLALLAALETQVREGQRLALQTQAEKLGTKCFICWKIEALAVPASTTVTPGADYQAFLFLAESPVSDFGYLTNTANHRPLPTSRENESQVVLPLPPASPSQPDTVRRQWQGRIRAQTYPADTTWTLTVPYSIVKSSAP
jgi:hypothetical protein